MRELIINLIFCIILSIIAVRMINDLVYEFTKDYSVGKEEDKDVYVVYYNDNNTDTLIFYDTKLYSAEGLNIIAGDKGYMMVGVTQFSTTAPIKK